MRPGTLDRQAVTGPGAMSRNWRQRHYPVRVGPGRLHRKLASRVESEPWYDALHTRRRA